MILWLIFNVFLAFTADPPNQNPMVCMMLENVRFKDSKCVPSTRDVCHSGQPGNCEIQTGTSSIECIYVKGTGFYYKPIDDWSMGRGYECVSRGDPICVGTGDSQVCHNGPCIKYRVPFCKRQCTACYPDNKKVQVPLGGCRRFCRDVYCNDEPVCDKSAYCPPGDMTCQLNFNQFCPSSKHPVDPTYILPRNPKPECQQSVNCPNTIPAPGEVVDGSATCEYQDGTPCEVDGRNIIVRTAPDPTCTPVEPQEDTITRQKVERCPWISYSGNVPTRNVPPLNACEPIEVGNRFPTDCCECPHLPDHNSAKCQSCGFKPNERYRCDSFWIPDGN